MRNLSINLIILLNIYSTAASSSILSLLKSCLKTPITETSSSRARSFNTILPSFRFNTRNLPSKYRPKLNENGKVVLYRGDYRGRERDGIMAKAAEGQDSEKFTALKEALESGDEDKINAIVEEHTNWSGESALISSTYTPKMAQSFAGDRRGFKKIDTTIYKIEIDPDRVFVDGDDIGKTGKQGEIFIIGEIRPEEIVAVKIDNSYERSELVEGRDADEIRQSELPRMSPGFNVREPANWRVVKEKQ